MTKSHLERKTFILACALYSIIQRSQAGTKAGTWRQELMWRLWRNTAYRLPTCDLLNMLYYSILDHQPKGSSAHSELGPSHVNHQWRKSTTLALWRYFHKWESLFLKDGSLHQVDIKLTSTGKIKSFYLGLRTLEIPILCTLTSCRSQCYCHLLQK